MGVIKVSVRGHAVKYFPGEQERFDFQADEPLTILDMLKALDVEPLLVMMANVNGQKQPKTATIKPGDEVLLFSPPSGG
jgi:molybdopterin converting factor small subunit